MIEFLKVVLNIITKKEVYGVVITLAVSYFVYKTVAIILEEIINHNKVGYERKKRTTITNLFKNVIKYFMILVAILIILSIYGVNVKGLVAGLGIAGTIIGLALQDTFKDIINGISIIAENYFVVGDMVSYNGFIGEVYEFGLKTTKIKNVSGEIMVIANRNILEINNLSQKEQNVLYNICLPYEQPVDRIEKIIEKNIIPEFKKIENINVDSVSYLGVNELADSCVKYLISFSCKRDKHWQAKRDANKIVLVEFGKHNISIPYHQLEVHYEKQL